MAETLKVKIQLRNDTYEQLQASTLILEQGEVAIVVDNTDTGKQYNGRFKVGDGSKKFSELPWADASSLKEAVTSLNDLKGAVTLTNGGTSASDNGIKIETDTTTNRVAIKNTGVLTIGTGDPTSYGEIKVNGNTNVHVSNYGILPNKLTLRDTGTNRDMVINIPTLSAGTDIPIMLAVPKNATAGATIAYTENITDAIDDNKVTVSAGNGISVSTTNNKNYTVTNTGVLKVTGDNYTGITTTNGEVKITNKSTLEKGTELGSVKLNGGEDVVVNGYGTFNDAIFFNKSGTASLAVLHAPNWTPEDTGVGADFYLPSVGGTLATTTDVNDVKTSLTRDISANTTSINTINGKIPNNASPTNQLVTNTELTNAIAGIHNWTYQVATTLPTASKDTMYIIYLIPHTHGDSDSYDEYITIESGTTTKTYTWEKIGNTDVDLSNYYTKADADNKFVEKLNGYSLINSRYATGLDNMLNNVGTLNSGHYVLTAFPSTTQGAYDFNTINLDNYALKTSIKDPDNYYWANVKVKTTSDSTTKPTFGGMSISNVSIAAQDTTAVSLKLPKESGNLISTGTILILDGGNANGFN